MLSLTSVSCQASARHGSIRPTVAAGPVPLGITVSSTGGPAKARSMPMTVALVDVDDRAKMTLDQTNAAAYVKKHAVHAFPLEGSLRVDSGGGVLGVGVTAGKRGDVIIFSDGDVSVCDEATFRTTYARVVGGNGRSRCSSACFLRNAVAAASDSRHFILLPCTVTLDENCCVGCLQLCQW